MILKRDILHEESLSAQTKREKLVEQTKALRAEGYTQEEIAVQLGVTQGTISLILRQHGLGGKLLKLTKTKPR